MKRERISMITKLSEIILNVLRKMLEKAKTSKEMASILVFCFTMILIIVLVASLAGCVRNGGEASLLLDTRVKAKPYTESVSTQKTANEAAEDVE